MSRAVVYQALINSAPLQALGIDQAHVIPNYDGEQRPNIPFSGDQPYFLVIRWGVQDIELGIQRGPRHFDIWVHMAQEFASAFELLDDIIEILDDTLTGIVDTPGGDGRSVTVIELEGRSRDLEDAVYQTYCRQSSYRMISRNTVTGQV